MPVNFVLSPSAVPASSRLPLYGGLVVAFVVLAAIAAAAGGAANPRLLYVALLFALCATPVLFARKLNDRYALYTIFLVIYFVSFGLLDVINLVVRGSSGASEGLLSMTELLILLGGGAFVLGYQFAATGMARRGVSQFVAHDWPMNSLLTVGLLLWGAGTFATWYWNIQLTVRSLEVNSVGAGATTLLMLGRYAQPLGILLLAYAYTISRSKLLAFMMVSVVALQVVLGFVSNTKGGAMLGGILVVVTGYLVRGKIPKTWLFAGALFITIAFPVFQAYRSVVVGDLGYSNAQAAQNIGQVLQLAIQGAQHGTEERTQSFFERSSVKDAVELMVRRVGVDVPYQHGATLAPLLTAFIPRILWPDKPDVQTGLLLNEQFRIAEAVVYLSPSHLGELYWNFGWPGALIGMLLIGLLLGWINSLCDLSTGVSVTRLMILAITVFEFGVRFEGAIAGEYEIWMRSVAGILIMHALFARQGLRHLDAASSAIAAPTYATSVPEGAALAPARFPNLMS
jgi:hypothetical protein